MQKVIVIRHSDEDNQNPKYVANLQKNKDGYIGIQFCRWVADVVGKKENIDWDKFK